MARTSTLPKRLQPMLATLTDAPFDHAGWIFEDKYDCFRMVPRSKTARSRFTAGTARLSATTSKIISYNYIEVAKALEGVKADAVIEGELVALDENGVSGQSRRITSFDPSAEEMLFFPRLVGG